MKKILFLLNIILSNTLLGQITLKECLESGIVNRANIKSARTEVLLANLKSIDSKSKYLPQLSLAYDYRYNPIIASQIVPVGQFNPVPTNETRAIQFGTNWQQNAGVSLYQPLIDFSLKSRIKESGINEKISGFDLKKAETELKYEVTKIYSRILTFEYQEVESISDTIRSFYSLSMLKAKFKEGKILKTELNNALVNHNNNMVNYKKTVASIINEKIYLHYLTNIELKRILEEKFTPIPVNIFNSLQTDDEIAFDSIIDFQKLLLSEKLLNQQIKTESTKNTPNIGFQGFVGANQYSQNFDPLLSNSWFGNSYIGLSVKMSVFSPDKIINGKQQLKTKKILLENQKDELKNDKKRALLQINIEIERLLDEIKFTQNNYSLLVENIKMYQERLQNGQLAATELNVQETELQKTVSQLKQLTERLNKANIEKLYISGKLDGKLSNI